MHVPNVQRTALGQLHRDLQHAFVDKAVWKGRARKGIELSADNREPGKRDQPALLEKAFLAGRSGNAPQAIRRSSFPGVGSPSFLKQNEIWPEPLQLPGNFWVAVRSCTIHPRGQSPDIVRHDPESDGVCHTAW